MELDIWDMLPAEQKYSYTQIPEIICRTGCIGYVREDMGADGARPSLSWTDHNPSLRTRAFSEELDAVLQALRSDPKYGTPLKDRASLIKYCFGHPSCRMDADGSFGFRADTERYAYLCRMDTGWKGHCGFHIYAYRRDLLDRHLEAAQNGIRFVDSSYGDRFILPDGGTILVTTPKGNKVTETCRYIDPYHMAAGEWCCHICEFAEKMEQGGYTVEPITRPLGVMRVCGKEKVNAGIDR